MKPQLERREFGKALVGTALSAAALSAQEKSRSSHP